MNHLFIKYQERCYRIKLTDICYIATIPEASHTIVIATVDKKYTLLGKIQDLEKDTDPVLKRCNRGLLVNPEHVTSVATKTYTLYFDNVEQDNLRIGRDYLSEFMNTWKQ